MAPYPNDDFKSRPDLERALVRRVGIMKRGKPHIYRRAASLWTCEGYRRRRSFFGAGNLKWVQGHGVTPAAAFVAWRSFFESDR